MNSGRRRPAESVLAAAEVLSLGEAENHNSVGVCGACVFSLVPGGAAAGPRTIL